MMKHKILPYGVMLAAGIVFAAGIDGRQADAAAIAAADITIDYANQKLTVKEDPIADVQSRDAEIFFATLTTKKVKGSDKKQVTPSAWDAYDYGKDGATVDLSFLNRAKENYIQVKGDKNADPVTIKIPAVLSKVSASFNIADATVSLSNVQDKKNPVELNGAVEYRTAYSGWKDYSKDDDDLSIYQQRGAKLYFRLKAAANQSLNGLTAADIGFVDKEGNVVQVYEVSCFPGVEKLVTVKKATGAPKVTVDYGKHLFTVPKNAEYRLVTPAKVTGWKLVGNDKGSSQLKLSELIPLMDKEKQAALEVRVAATATKVASKAQRIAIDLPQDTPIFTGEGENVQTNAAAIDALISNDYFDNGVGTDSFEDEFFVWAGCEYKQTTKAFTGIVLGNYSSDIYEVYIARKDEARPGQDVKKVYTLKAKPATSTKETKLLIKKDLLEEGDKIYIRKKADAKGKVWSSNFAGLGTVRFDKITEHIEQLP